MTIATPEQIRDGIICKGLKDHYKESLENNSLSKERMNFLFNYYSNNNNNL